MHISHLALTGFAKTYMQVLQAQLKVHETIVPHIPAISWHSQSAHWLNYGGA